LEILKAASDQVCSPLPKTAAPLKPMDFYGIQLHSHFSPLKERAASLKLVLVPKRSDIAYLSRSEKERPH
jgi:hypothetical protein